MIFTKHSEMLDPWVQIMAVTYTFAINQQMLPRQLIPVIDQQFTTSISCTISRKNMPVLLTLLYTI